MTVAHDLLSPSIRSVVGSAASISRPAPLLDGSPRRSMERGAPDLTQSKSGVHLSPPTALKDAQSQGIAPDQQSTFQANGASSSFSAAATPSSDYSANPTSARSATFPEHIQRPQFYPSSTHGVSGAGMAQSTSPSIPLQDGRSSHHNAQVKSDADVPIDPSIAASSPTYPPHGPQYSPYPPQQQMSHGYPQHPGGSMYAQPRPDWSNYSEQPHHNMPPQYPTTGVSTPTSAAPAGARPGQSSQVYSFVPIPGAQQHKRPRRRYEEIERMYKCGWNGCEKAYGTLNHLNAHVTMQSHGQKRTPEEFKEIRKEWKQRKKDEESQRKADEERARAAAAQANPADGPPNDSNPPPPGYPQGPRQQVQLPPIGYQPGTQVPGGYQAPPGGVQQLQEYSNNHIYSGYPASPYGAPTPMYNQHNGNSTQSKYEH